MHPSRRQRCAEHHDVMAAQGMTQNRAEMGFSGFRGKWALV